MEAFAAGLTDRLILLSAAFALAALWRDAWRGHLAARRSERLLMALVFKLNRQRRGVATRVYRGLVFVLLTVLMAAAFGAIIAYAQHISPPLALLEVLMIAYLLPVRSLRDKASAVGKAVHRGQLAQAKGLAAPLARREVAALDSHGLLRISVEYIAENINDTLLAPLLWYLLLGLPALCVLRLVNWLDHLIGHTSPDYLAFGWAAAKCDDLLMWIPARLSALLIVLASLFVPKGKPLAALMTCLRQARKTKSPNAGWPLAAMAGALGVALGGARAQEGARIDDGWMGKGSARMAYSDFRRALNLYAVAMLLVWLSCLLALAALI